MNTAIEVQNLTVIRGTHPVLTDFSCEISHGHVTGLLGPSGAGKTTLIRCLVGTQRIDSGSVTVFGMPAGSLAVRRRTGYVTQAPSIYLDLTVSENVRHFAAIMGTSRATAESAVESVGLARAADQAVHTLSGGQRSRASLACALVGNPDLLVLDEPTVGQDPLLREELWNHFRRLADAGATVVVSSHVMDEANRCDQLLLLRDGTLFAADTPAGIKRVTGKESMDDAFLALIRDTESVTTTGA